MWKRRRSPVTELADAARRLSRNPDVRDRDAVLAQLGGAFCDVRLPSYPMPLRDGERRRVTTAAAAELAALLRTASRSSSDDLQLVCEQADGLWREIAAANWDIVEGHEMSRTFAARKAVMKVAAVLGMRASEQTGEEVPLHAVLQVMLAEIDTPGSVLSEQLRDPLAAMGVGLPHARRALVEELALTRGPAA